MKVPGENIQMFMRILSVIISVFLNTIWMKKSISKVDEIVFLISTILALLLGFLLI